MRKYKTHLLAMTGVNIYCTIVADEPYYYQPCEIEFEDDEDYFAQFEADCKKLKAKLDTIDRLSCEEIIMTKTLPELTFDKYAHMNEITEMVEKFYLLRELWSDHSIKVVFSDQVACCEVDKTTIRLNPNQTPDRAFIALARCLRRATRKTQYNPMQFDPDAAILYNRIIIADEVVFTVRAAYEAHRSGYSGPWREMNQRFGEVCRAFEIEAAYNFRTINSGRASAIAFETWFLHDYPLPVDKKLVEKMLQDVQGYVFSNNKSSKELTIEIISAIGEMPFGKNYLSEHASKILSDPIFSEVRAKNTANFIWFIKFERSFRETEKTKQLADPTAIQVQASNPSDRGVETVVQFRPK